MTKNEITELCKGLHCVDLGESFQKHIYSQMLASIQPRTIPVKFARSPPPGLARNRRGLPPHAPAPTRPHTYTCHRLTLLHPDRYLVVGEIVVTRKRRNNTGKMLAPVLAVCGCHTRELVPLSLIHAKRNREKYFNMDPGRKKRLHPSEAKICALPRPLASIEDRFDDFHSPVSAAKRSGLWAEMKRTPSP